MRGFPPLLEHAGLCSRLSAEQASLSQLLAALGAAQACCLDGAAAACLEAAADKLAASGGRWPAGQAGELAAFDPATLARLLQLLSVRAVGSAYRSPAVFDVRPDCSDDREGGFTWCIQGFSRLGGVQEPGLLSPWVEVGGFQWRLQVRRRGGRGARARMCGGNTPPPVSCTRCEARAGGCGWVEVPSRPPQQGCMHAVQRLLCQVVGPLRHRAGCVQVYPSGKRDGAGTHLSSELACGAVLAAPAS